MPMQPHRRPVRRTAVLAVAALAFAAPTLSSCGFRYATDRVYTPAAGLNDRSGEVDILGAVVVASRAGEGTLVASLSNGSATDAISLQSVTPASDAKVQVATFPAIDVAPRRDVDLATKRIAVTGDFGAGDVLTLTFAFSNGQSVTTGVTTVTNCDEFAGFDTAFADAPKGGATTGSPSSSAEATPSASPSASAAAEGEPYSCDFATPNQMPGASIGSDGGEPEGSSIDSSPTPAE
ncbi:hypothetical protein K8Z61_10860 [Nocardioides sp. TRM66260-LWL]|uniref:hypothetical protein n=1 Tax=Nocardioides sp. TRM66260-LWL TaxID=2874478 RepID=UPI001CC36069|nr:hypothetical protein [Nocardioides sp. TRM66260-LWL]MBZ5734998.1 hypothetical protein [Nocardioides sp. TRM66260-LWL]